MADEAGVEFYYSNHLSGVSRMLEIEELVLRVPGYTREEARQLGQEVARRVADGLSDQQSSVDLDTLNLRVNVPPGT